MKSSVRNRLFVMMVLEFFIWGAWLPLVWPYMGELGFTAVQIALVGSAFAIAAVRRPSSSATSSPTAISPPRSSWPSATSIGGPGHAGAVLDQVVPACSSP